MKGAILVLCIIGSVVAGRNQKLQPKIVNGYDAKISSFPSMVSIRLNERKVDEHNCGGTLLNEEWVLTAARCFTMNEPAEKYSVQYGNTEISPAGSSVVKVAKIISHEGFVDKWISFINDIAVVKLAKPISDPPEGFRVKLPIYGSNVLTGSPAVAAGWGVNSSNAEVLQKTLKAVDLVAFSGYKCKQAIQALANSSRSRQSFGEPPIFETHVCGGVSLDIEELEEMLADPTKLKGTCHYDNGGPFFVDGVQVGIMSFEVTSEPCGLLPAVYTATSFYVKWIAEKTGINLEPNIFLRSEAKLQAASCSKSFEKSHTKKDKKGEIRKNQEANSKRVNV